ncbi:hypothetical protein BDSB_05960 [Burkholderia dolosa PC543]|nr:hypothetical protein BDSB_05960 [Burkholderia dolosa PC543]
MHRPARSTAKHRHDPSETPRPIAYDNLLNEAADR